MRNVFISYMREHESAVEELAADVRGVGHTVWHDQKLSGGQRWWDGILKQIRECDVFVIALGPGTLDSTACRRELGYAQRLARPVLPVQVAGGVSTNLLPADISQLQIIEHHAHDREALMTLARAITALPKAPALPEPLPEPPEVPLSYLGGLSERVDAIDRADHAEQSALFLELKQALKDSASATDARVLLKKMASKPSLLATISDEIRGALADGTPPRKNQSATAATSNVRKIVLAATAVAAIAVILFATQMWSKSTKPINEGPVDAWAVEKPAQPDPAATPVGATITGRILFAGSPVSEVSTAPATVTLRGTDDAPKPDVEFSYDHTTGVYEIRNVPVGRFHPSIHVDSGYPFDQRSGGDFESTLSNLNDPIDVPRNATRIERDLKVVQSIRLKRPVDNQERRTLTTDPIEVFSAGNFAPSARVFEWDPVPKAASYTVSLSETSAGFTLNDRDRGLPLSQSTRSTSFRPGSDVLLPNNESYHYVFSLRALDENGELIGYYKHYYINGFSSSMKFKVVAGRP